MQSNAKINRHLQTGKRLIDPYDDAGDASKLSTVRGELKSNFARIQNLQNSLSFAQVQDGAMKVAGEILNRSSELKTLYEGPTADVSTKKMYDEEFAELQKELKNIVDKKWNGISLFSKGEDTINLGNSKHVDALNTIDRNGQGTIAIQRAGLFGHLKAPIAIQSVTPPIDGTGSNTQQDFPVDLLHHTGRITFKQNPASVPDLFTIKHGGKIIHEVMYGSSGGSTRTMGNGETHTVVQNGNVSYWKNEDVIEFGKGADAGNTSMKLEFIINRGDLPGGYTWWRADATIEYDPIVPDLVDPANVWSLSYFSQDDFSRFRDTLTTARAQNASEQHRIQNEIADVQNKQIGLESSLEKIESLDYSLELTRYSRARDQLHTTANLVSAAREMENVLYTDFLGD
jgi:flagellin-like hook-associated protein FlgL